MRNTGMHDAEARSGRSQSITACRVTAIRKLMTTPCLACHAKVTRTLHLQCNWPPLLRTLWREQHLESSDQTRLNFAKSTASLESVSLKEGGGRGPDAGIHCLCMHSRRYDTPYQLQAGCFDRGSVRLEQHSMIGVQGSLDTWLYLKTGFFSLLSEARAAFPRCR